VRDSAAPPLFFLVLKSLSLSLARSRLLALSLHDAATAFILSGLAYIKHSLNLKFSLNLEFSLNLKFVRVLYLASLQSSLGRLAFVSPPSATQVNEACMCVCMYVCMYVCMSLYIYIHVYVYISHWLYSSGFRSTIVFERSSGLP